MSATDKPLLSVRDLKKHFPIKGGILGRTQAMVQAVDGVSFDVRAGETLGIVGESGCGKSTTAKLLIGLVDRDEGDIDLGGKSLGRDISLRALRRDIQMVFQDSYASLNPRMTILDSIAFGARVQGLDDPEGRARGLMARVGLDPDRFAGRYPHELSGGQRQRINIAAPWSCRPRSWSWTRPSARWTNRSRRRS
ncbi:ATP-binding cassette domain-containing protein [Paracoccus sp. NBH48]|uniref:ATP-binding cassette domain-containing protein n=1 Tax=Paracoccus sp. NBH48 TaxID=2596918 RepID=UPI0021049CA3|nr:ATP-binding cassette domain-containing protein [Paracoccus sp. NBH48]